MSIKEITQTKVYTVNIDTNLKQASIKMFKKNIGSVIVIEKTVNNQSIPVGIITDRDIAKAFFTENFLNPYSSVKDIMSSKLVSCDEDEGIFNVIKLMKNNGIKRLPIVNKNKHLIGIVSSEDILDLLSTEIKELSQLTRTERLNEAHTRNHKIMPDILGGETSLPTL